MELQDLSYIIRGAIFKVNTAMGVGLLESVYEAALIYELKQLGLNVKSQVDIPVYYNNVKLEIGFRIDILVDEVVIIEIKSVEILKEIHKKQLINYLKLSKLKLGFLVNFNVTTLIEKESLVRIIN
jgi:GxxExxY protein